MPRDHSLKRMCALCWLLIGSCSVQADALKLHVPSPDWREQVIYFVMIDRFNDGDSSNNQQSKNDFSPNDSRKYSGGDLRGIQQQLDYISGLGATALWITPPVAHQWWDGNIQYGGYHGYWGENFSKVDAHFGSLRDYQQLSDALHRRQMYLVQDIVVNHTGNYFTVDKPAADGALPPGFRLNERSEPPGPPSQPPFDRNDVRKAADRKAAIYHWTPTIADFSQVEQERTWQLAELDDLNTDNPTVRRALRQSYGDWIKNVGVDAFRIDTAYYVASDYFDDFLNSRDRQAPGILQVARATGRKQFLAFGEGFGIDPPHTEQQAKKIESYMHTAAGKPLLPSMINFPLYGSTLDVLTRALPTAVLADRIESMQRLHPNLGQMPSFVDNHDVDRFLKSGSVAALRQALLLIMTLPGIPVIYYGTEQGFTGQRQAMFAKGFAAGGMDHFNPENGLYRHIAELSKLRRSQRALRHGRATVLASTAAGAGVLAWVMASADERLLVVLNSSDAPALLDRLAPTLPPDRELQPLFLQGLEPQPLALDGNGSLALALPARSAGVWRIGDASVAPAAGRAKLSVAPLRESRFNDDFDISGQSEGIVELQLVVDGALRAGSKVAINANGKWRARVDTRAMFDPQLVHELVLWAPALKLASKPLSFRVAREWQPLLEQVDPANDDHGPKGNYQYPTDPGWNANRQLDIRKVRVLRAGAALKLSLQMASISQQWNPANGFDHVNLTAYFVLPNRSDGAQVLPRQNALLPNGARWQYRLRVGGWSNALFSAAAASAENEGTPTGPSAKIVVDRANNSIELLLPPGALGDGDSLDGLQIYLTTWDYDGDYRELAPDPAPMRFGGGERDGPKIMDDLWLQLPPTDKKPVQREPAAGGVG